MTKQVVGLFDTMAEAQSAVEALHRAGFTAADISLVGSNRSRIYDLGGAGGAEATSGDTTEAAEGAGAGATAGTVLGGLTGLLMGVGALAIPGIGPVVGGGILLSALGTAALGAGIGAATGGLLGALVGAGIPEEDAHVYAEGVRRGGALLTVTADDARAEQAADILDEFGVVDIDQRGNTLRERGWLRFNPDAGEYQADTAETDYAESSKVGTAGGGAAGAMTGAAIGAAGGPVGAVIGGVAGALAGGTAGAVGDTLGEKAADAALGDDNTTSSMPAQRLGDATANPSYPSATMPDYSATSAQNVSLTSDTPPETSGGMSWSDSATAPAQRGEPGDPATEYADSSKVGTVGGGAAGAMTGAAIGAVGGPVGAVIGGVAGALAGGTAGAIGDTVGETVEDSATRADNLPSTPVYDQDAKPPATTSYSSAEGRMATADMDPGVGMGDDRMASVTQETQWYAPPEPGATDSGAGSDTGPNATNLKAEEIFNQAQPGNQLGSQAEQDVTGGEVGDYTTRQLPTTQQGDDLTGR